MMKLISSYLFCMFFSFILTAQDTQFQTVDHDSRHAHVQSMKAYNGGVLFSTTNDALPKTRLNYVDSDQVKHILFESEYFHHSTVKYIPRGDGTITMYMVGLFDYDVPVGAVYKFDFDGENTTFEEMRYWEDFNYITDIAETEDPNQILVYLNDDLINLNLLSEEQESAPENGVLMKLINTSSGDTFVAYTSGVYKYESGSIFSKVFETASIQHINVLADDSFAVSFGDSVHIYDKSFENKIAQYKLPQGYQQMSEVGEKAGLYYVEMRNEEKVYSTWRTNDIYEFEQIRVEDEGVEIFHLDVFGDQILTGGTFETLKPTGLVRSFFDSNIQQYKEIDISLDELNLIHTGQDTTNIYVTPDGDTLYTFDYSFDIEYTVTNQGIYPINHFDVYSLDIAYPKRFFHIEQTELIEIGETKEFTTSLGYRASAQDISSIDLTFYIPGANHLMDANFNDNTYDANILSSIDNEQTIIPFSVYPNPSSGKLVLPSEDFINVRDVKIIGLNGTVLPGLKTKSNVLDIEHLPQGMYILQYKDEGKLYQAKFVKN